MISPAVGSQTREARFNTVLNRQEAAEHVARREEVG
jgi:hypothetical protein